MMTFNSLSTWARCRSHSVDEWLKGVLERWTCNSEAPSSKLAVTAS